MNEVSVKKSNSKITQASIDRAHLLKKRFPDMKYNEIAQSLYGGSYTPKLYSVTVIANMLKVETLEQYLELPIMKHRSVWKPNSRST